MALQYRNDRPTFEGFLGDLLLAAPGDAVEVLVSNSAGGLPVADYVDAPKLGAGSYPAPGSVVIDAPFRFIKARTTGTGATEGAWQHIAGWRPFTVTIEGGPGAWSVYAYAADPALRRNP